MAPTPVLSPRVGMRDRHRAHGVVASYEAGVVRSTLDPQERTSVPTPPGASRAAMSRHGAQTRGGPDASAASAQADRTISRTLAARWIATLDERPFRPTPQQLALVDGGDLVAGEARDRRRPIAAARYASLFTDHVVQDMAAEGAPGAYVRIWLCARRAFIEDMSTATSLLSEVGLASWENEGGAAP